MKKEILRFVPVLIFCLLGIEIAAQNTSYGLYKKSTSLRERKVLIANAKKNLDEIKESRGNDKAQIELKYRLLFEKEKEFLELSPEDYIRLRTYNNEDRNDTRRDEKKNYELQKLLGADKYTVTLSSSRFILPQYEYYFGYDQWSVANSKARQPRKPLYCEGACEEGLLNGFHTIRCPGFFIISGNFVDGVLEGLGMIKTEGYLIQSDFKNGIPNGNTFILDDHAGQGHYLYDMKFKEIWDVEILKQLTIELLHFITENFDNKEVLEKNLGLRVGKGNYNFFIGKIVNGKAEGQCIHTGHNSTHYEVFNGEFKNGKRDGEGSQYNFKIVRVREDRQTKDVAFSGTWEEGKLVNRSEMIVDGKKVKVCEGDCENGIGKKIYKNGDVYEGRFKNGKRHGQGTYSYNRYNSKYIGEWKNDQKDGYGEFIGVWGLGNSKKGYWVRGDYYGKYPPKDYSGYRFELDEITENTYWYDIFEGDSKVFRLQVSTYFTNSGNIEISSFLGKQFSIGGLYDPSEKTLHKDEGIENNISNVQYAIERLLEIKLGK
jgi:hypothetical protein